MLNRALIEKALGHAVVALGVAADPIELVDNAPPTEFRVFKGGVNTSTKGSFVFDDAAADAVMASFAKRGLTPKMDYEHQSINTVKNGQPAPNSAYSWTPQVRRGADGQPELWATDVKWCDRAFQMIGAREYSYFSPLFETDDTGDTERVTAVLNLALTNLPALDNIDELIAATSAEGKDRPMAKKMKCSKCMKALRAPSDDDDGDEVACSVCLTNATAAKALTALSVAVGLKGDASESTALSAVQELVVAREDLKKLTGADSVPAALGILQAWKESHGQVVALRAEVEGAKQTSRNTEFVELLDKAMTGKIITKDFRETYWEKVHAPGGQATENGLVQLRAFVGAKPPAIVREPVKPPQVGPGPLPTTQLAMASEMGMSPEKLERFRQDRETQMQSGG